MGQLELFNGMEVLNISKVDTGTKAILVASVCNAAENHGYVGLDLSDVEVACDSALHLRYFKDKLIIFKNSLSGGKVNAIGKIVFTTFEERWNIEVEVNEVNNEVSVKLLNTEENVSLLNSALNVVRIVSALVDLYFKFKGTKFIHLVFDFDTDEKLKENLIAFSYENRNSGIQNMFGISFRKTDSLILRNIISRFSEAHGMSGSHKADFGLKREALSSDYIGHVCFLFDHKYNKMLKQHTLSDKSIRIVIVQELTKNPSNHLRVLQLGEAVFNKATHRVYMLDLDFEQQMQYIGRDTVTSSNLSIDLFSLGVNNLLFDEPLYLSKIEVTHELMDLAVFNKPDGNAYTSLYKTVKVTELEFLCICMLDMGFEFDLNTFISDYEGPTFSIERVVGIYTDEYEAKDSLAREGSWTLEELAKGRKVKKGSNYN